MRVSAAVTIAALPVAYLVLAALLGVVFALATDDRDPSIVLGWLFVILLVPVLGLVAYFFIGRNYRRETTRRRQLRASLAEVTHRVLAPVGGSPGSAAGTVAAPDGSPGRRVETAGRHEGGFPPLRAESVRLFGVEWSLEGLSGALLYLLGLGGEVLLLSSIYMVMPVGRLSWQHALIGGVTATVLWDIARHVLVWYFSTLSQVNVVYGSMTTAIIVMFSLEIGATLLLFGAQVISEFERAYLRELLVQHHGNISQAARRAGIDRKTIHRMLVKYELGPTV